MIFGLFELFMIFQDLGNMVFRAVLYKPKTQETQTFVFFSRDTRHAFVALSKSTAIGVEVQKFTKV